MFLTHYASVNYSRDKIRVGLIFQVCVTVYRPDIHLAATQPGRPFVMRYNEHWRRSCHCWKETGSCA